jgi:hypothetical protein
MLQFMSAEGANADGEHVVDENGHEANCLDDIDWGTCEADAVGSDAFAGYVDVDESALDGEDYGVQCVEYDETGEDYGDEYGEAGEGAFEDGEQVAVEVAVGVVVERAGGDGIDDVVVEGAADDGIDDVVVEAAQAIDNCGVAVEAAQTSDNGGRVAEATQVSDATMYRRRAQTPGLQRLYVKLAKHLPMQPNATGNIELHYPRRLPSPTTLAWAYGNYYQDLCKLPTLTALRKVR